MDSTANSIGDSFKSKKILHPKEVDPSSPSPSGKKLLLGPHHQWSSKTPEKPVDPPRRSRNRGAALSLKEVREAAMKLRKSDPGPIEKPDPIFAEQIGLSPESKPKKRPESSIVLPEKYEMLDKIFHSLDNSIRLCRMKGTAASFTNVSPKMECLTDRRFTYNHLAQIKFILPEAIEIKKILVHDERTSCMKPELLLTLDAKAVEVGKNVKLESGSGLLRKIFRSRLVDYFKAHPQDDDIPEDDLPEPFNGSKKANQTNTEIIQESSTCTEIPQIAPLDKKPLNLSHMAPSFRKSFSQKATTKMPNQEGIVGSGTLTRVSVPIFTQSNVKRQCPPPEAASLAPKKLTPFATPVKHTKTEMIATSVGTSLATPVKHTNSEMVATSVGTPLATPVKHTKSEMIGTSVGTPGQFDSTPAKLSSATPRLAPPKRCYTTPDNDDVTTSLNKLLRRPSRSRSLKFDNTTENVHELEEVGDEKGCLSVDDDILDVLPESLIRSIQEKETKALMEKDPAISQAKWRKQMLAGLPKMFDMIYFLFQSINRSVLTKEELLQKVISSNLDILDRKEAQEQLRLLQELAPEWIYEKMGLSGDSLLCVNKISSPDEIRSRIAEAV